MYNLIKMELYKLRKNTAIKVILLVSLISSIFTVYFFTTFPDVPVLWKGYLINALRDSGLNIVLCAIFAGLFIGVDFSNKTINHEIISGHSRAQVLISKAISFLIGSSIIILVYPIVSILGAMAFNGFAEVFTSSDLIYVLRVLSLNFILNLGVMSILLFTAFIFKDIGKTIGISIVLLAFGMQFLNMLGSQIIWIGKLNKYSVFAQVSIAVKDIISKSEIGIIFLSSIITVVVFLSISYMSFRRTELR